MFYNTNIVKTLLISNHKSWKAKDIYLVLNSVDNIPISDADLWPSNWWIFHIHQVRSAERGIYAW